MLRWCPSKLSLLEKTNERTNKTNASSQRNSLWHFLNHINITQLSTNVKTKNDARLDLFGQKLNFGLTVCYKPVFLIIYLVWEIPCNCTARQCSPLRRKFIECFIIKPARSLLMKHLVIGQR